MSEGKAVVLSVQDLCKQFGAVRALDAVDFELRRGEIHALCGENGAGKSTLIKCLSGYWPYGSYAGTIEVFGEPARYADMRDCRELGVIYQELALVPEMSVAENIFLGQEPLLTGGRIDWVKLYTRTRELLKEFKLEISPTARVGELGIGQQQLVEILKALAREHRILLLDEPTAALSEQEVQRLLAMLKTLRKREISIIYISHRLEEVFAIADRITVLRDGRSVASLEAKQTDRDELVRQMVGRTIEDFYPRRKSELGKVRLAVEELTVKDPLSGQECLRQISFEVRAGEVLGIGGLMGAGRTELLTHLAGAWGERVSGKVILDEAACAHRNPNEAIRQGLVLVSEDRKRYGIIPEQGVGFNESLSSLDRYRSGPLLDLTSELHSNLDFFKRLGVKAESLDSRIRELSGGNQQKVLLARALMTEPRVVLLDEPTRGIDVGAKVEIYEQINQLTEQGCAVVLVSSELPELLHLSDRILMLSGGRQGGCLDAKEASQERLMEAALKYA